ncbi:MAG: 3-deoxy-D-manno-octulosonic acid transferase [Bernardetiaceae bacterium]|nr:3-deoxy-D-manno-octulosonic acid transferase [Bernardetiaceae bacterium]
MQIFYNVAIAFYAFFLELASFFNPKARLFTLGRRDILTQYARYFEQKRAPVWLHCASLGEFEQARPLIERIHREQPEQKILLTFFSPSGYEVRKDYELADWVLYLPLDRYETMQKLVQLVRPRLFVFVKYEFWANLIQALDKAQVPMICISAIFRKEQHFFKPYGKWARKKLQKIDYFFVQDKHSIDLLNQIQIKEASAVGDTRVDRVVEIAAQAKKFPIIESFCQNINQNTTSIWVLGSAWDSDIRLFAEAMEKADSQIKLIIAPHEITKTRIDFAVASFSNHKIGIYSELENKTTTTAFDVLIIDNIGMLASLYAVADAAFIGGAYEKGLHNTLEAAVYGIPMFFGNKNYKKFKEANELIAQGAALAIPQAQNLTPFLKSDAYPQLKIMGQKAANYVQAQKGATDKIISYCKTVGWL